MALALNIYFSNNYFRCKAIGSFLCNRQSTVASTNPAFKFQPRRSLLYIPGHDVRKIAKVASLDVDCVVLDCEDGVATNRKVTARDVIRQTLGTMRRNPKTTFAVRINSVFSGLAEADLTAILGSDDGRTQPDAIVIPKVENTNHVDWLVDCLMAHRKKNDACIRLMVLIESARSLLDMDTICTRFEERLLQTKWDGTIEGPLPFRLDAAIFGSDDFCASIGVTRTTDATELLYARQRFVVVAKAHRLHAIDMVHIDYKDLDGLKEACVRGAQLGFTGKQLIHPDQVPAAQAAFVPSPEQIRWATELILTFQEHQSSGQGVFTSRGSMIDMPSVRQAQNVIEMSKLIVT